MAMDIMLGICMPCMQKCRVGLLVLGLCLTVVHIEYQRK